MSSLASLSAALAPFEEDDITEEDTEHNDVTESRRLCSITFYQEIKTHQNLSLESRNLDYGRWPSADYLLVCTTSVGVVVNCIIYSVVFFLMIINIIIHVKYHLRQSTQDIASNASNGYLP